MKGLNMDTISISEIQRNLHRLEDFDIIKVVDKKRNQVKGYFLDEKYHDLIEELYQAKTNKLKKRLKALEEMGTYSLGGSNIKDIKANMYED